SLQKYPTCLPYPDRWHICLPLGSGNVLSLQDITAFVIKYMQVHYPNLVEDRYAIDPDMEDMWDIFVAIGKRRGALESGGNVNFDKVADIVLQDLRTGKLGNITLETI